MPTTATIKSDHAEISAPELAPEELRAIVLSAWRPAWSIRRRVGCLAPLIAWWKEVRAKAH